MTPRSGARRRFGTIRFSLVLLALVPCVTLTALWGVTTTRMLSEGLRLREQTDLGRATGAMGTEAALALQRERRLTAALLGSPKNGTRTALEAQREETDRVVAGLVEQSDRIARAPARISERLNSVLGSVASLEYYRAQADRPTDISPRQVLDHYSAIIDEQVRAFQQLSQVDDGDLTSQAGPLVSMERAAELVSQEDALLALHWPGGHLEVSEWNAVARLVHARRWLIEDQILPQLSGEAREPVERLLNSGAWRTLTGIEDQVLAARGAARDGKVPLPDAHGRWATAMEELAGTYTRLIRDQTTALLDRSADEADALLLTSVLVSAGGLLAVAVCVGVSWRITRSLSHRLEGLRAATLSLAEERLPEVVARLERGEKVDVDSAAPPLHYGDDELGAVAGAFNQAQRTALHTAVELAETRRGFQKVILGIARQSQNLVNLQLARLDALERRHTDPEVLKGLYELDSTASQLRRYEENLVVISGERPGRSWAEPVALVDILRGAVGEVAQYQRVEVRVDEDVSLVPPAVADVIHLLAELIDNATVYSAEPAPVVVRALPDDEGVTVEVEDRGLGMSEEEYASMNAQLAEPPQFDVIALADDLRLGMFVIGRLAARHRIAVTLGPNPEGGTTAVVRLPQDIVVRTPEDREDAPAAEGEDAPAGDREDTPAGSSEAPAGRSRGERGAGLPSRSPLGGKASTTRPASGNHTGEGSGKHTGEDAGRDAETVSGSGTSVGTAEEIVRALRKSLESSAEEAAPDGSAEEAASDGGRPARTGSGPAAAPRSALPPRPRPGAGGPPARSSTAEAPAPLPRRVRRASSAPDPAPATPFSASSAPSPSPAAPADRAASGTAAPGRTPASDAFGPEDGAEAFTPERAAASLGGFQRGTARARREHDESATGTPCAPPGAAENPGTGPSEPADAPYRRRDATDQADATLTPRPPGDG